MTPHAKPTTTLIGLIGPKGKYNFNNIYKGQKDHAEA